MSRVLTTSAVTMGAVALTVTLLAIDQTREQKLPQAIDLIESKGDLARAMPLLDDVAKSADRALAARALLYLAQAQERQGKDQARKTYERIIRDFSAQTDIVAQARARLAALGGESRVPDVRLSQHVIWTAPEKANPLPLAFADRQAHIADPDYYANVDRDADLLTSEPYA